MITPRHGAPDLDGLLPRVSLTEEAQHWGQGVACRLGRARSAGSTWATCRPGHIGAHGRKICSELVRTAAAAQIVMPDT